MYQYNGKEKQDELDLGWLDYGARMYQPEIGRWNAIDPMADAYYSNSAYSYVLGNPIANRDQDGMWTVSEHHRMTLDALSRVGIGGEQAQLIAHYSSVYADNPGGHLALNNLIYKHPANQHYYIQGIDYSATKNSQVTRWYPGDGENYNVWHSMRSFYEMYANKRGGRAFGISAKDAMARGMKFGWDKIFESASSGVTLSEMQKNSEEIQAFGQGMHALQDAYAHQGRHDVGVSHLYNDIYGDTKQAEAISKSAVVVHKLLTNDFSGIKTNQIKIVTEGMSTEQISTVMKQIGQYFNYLNERKKKEEK
jgi:RHS repeat-associated protein